MSATSPRAPDFWHAVPGMALLFDDHGDLHDESPASRERLGLMADGRDWLNRAPDSDSTRVRQLMREAAEFETDIAYAQTRQALTSGVVHHLRLCARRDPTAGLWVGSLIDLSAHHHRCKEAWEEQTFLQSFCDAVPVMMSFYDRNLLLQFANRAYKKQYGLEHEPWLGLHVSRVLGATHALNAPFQDKVLTDNTPTAFRRGLNRPDGRPQWIDIALVPINGADGLLLGIASLTLDVTSQHETQRALQESETRLAQFFDANAEGLVFHDNGRVLDANPAACALLGQGVQALLGTSLPDRAVPTERAQVLAVLIGDEDRAIEARLHDHTGRPIAVELIGRTLWRDGRRLRALVIRDMRDRQAAQARIHALIKDLRSQKDRAEAADRAKSVFLAAASHDLRQPIHAMGLFLSALRTIAHNPGAARHNDLAEICRRMQSSLDGLGQLLNMLLDVSRLDANAVQVQPAPTALNPLFIEIEQQFADIAHEKGLRLHVAPCSAWVHTDATVLRRILSNLMANAVRYTPRGRVLLGARRRSDHIEIQVCDSGIGIAPEQLEAIFEEFYQVGQSRAGHDEAHGLGLGLSIVKRSARLIGAELLVRSTPGRGSLFSVSVPSCAPLIETTSTAPAPSFPGQRNVLVIDDDEQILMGMQQLLQLWGHRVWCAASADAAVVLAIEHAAHIDLLLSDYRLGGNTTAVQAIAAVHACLGRPVPTFILTGDTSPQRIQEASELGFPLLHKPVNANALMAALAA